MIVEPVAGQHGRRAARPTATWPALREACDRTGALLILDEVITGFRVARGGAQERYGVRADITCFGQDHRRRAAGGRVRRPRAT